MIKNINRVSKVKNILSKSQTTQFNSSLPVSIEVKEEIDPLRYLLLIGNKELSTKSRKKLDVGAKYWGNFKGGKEGVLNLSNLKKKPSFFNKSENFTLKFNTDIIISSLQKKDPKKNFKSQLLQKLALSSSADEFFAIGNIILALNQNIFVFPMKQGNKKELFQLKNDLNEKAVEFYGAFENIGPVKGKIKNEQDGISAKIYVSYKKTYAFLKQELSELGFEAEIFLKDNISPLYENPKILLDMKG